jgi:hypothetical protein
VDKAVAVLVGVVLGVQAVLAAHLEQELNQLNSELAPHLVDLAVAVQGVQDLKGNMVEEVVLVL